MRTPRFLAGVLAAVLTLALVGTAPAHARVPAADPLATTVTGTCAGGPGRLSLTVHPPAGGEYRVEVAARGLVEESRWAVQVVQEGDETSRAKDFRRVAVDGGWTVETRFSDAGFESGEVFFNMGATDRGDRDHACFLFGSPVLPTFGASACNNQRQFVALFVRERDDGSTVVRSFIFGARRDSRWHLRLAAIGAASRQGVEFNDRERRSVVESRAVFTGVKDPRLRLVATSSEGWGRCLIGLDPPNVTTDAPLKMQGLDRLIASQI